MDATFLLARSVVTSPFNINRKTVILLLQPVGFCISCLRNPLLSLAPAAAAACWSNLIRSTLPTVHHKVNEIELVTACQ
jgi:hypothetical protein